MIFLSNISFAFIIIFILLYNGVRQLWPNKNILNGLLILGSTIILGTIVSYESLAIIGGLSLAIFFIGKRLSFQIKRKRLYLSLSIGVLIALFCFKNYNLVNFDLLQRVGLSYILFRLIHFLVDSSKGKIHDYDAIAFINYVIFFPTFMAGPIDEYNNFNYWIKQKKSHYRLKLMKAGLFKLCLGIVKKFFLVPIIVSYSLNFSLFDSEIIWQESLLISLVLYSFYILFDFSGYSDIAIGTAYLIGIKTPENFDNPYYSKSLSVFWKKWHMTFSIFLFKYVFKPFVTSLSKKFPNLPRLAGSSIGYVFTFLICGIWHGNTLNFIYWGLWHGLGLIGFKLWEIYVFKSSFKTIKNQWYKGFYSASAIIVTFIFVTIGWFFFNYQHNDIVFVSKNFAKPNDTTILVNQINYNGTDCFEISFKPEKETDQFIDIEYISSSNNRTLAFYNLPVDSSNQYHILIEETNNTAVALKLRSKSKSEIHGWHHIVTHARINPFEQSPIQAYFFGKDNFTKKTVIKIDTLLGKDLNLEAEFAQQKLKLDPIFIPNYGWAIKIHYLPLPSYKMNAEFQHNNGLWNTYVENRDAKYDFLDIHGNYEFDGTTRNLLPGKYRVRLNYSVGTKKSTWFYGTVNIPDYVDG